MNKIYFTVLFASFVALVISQAVQPPIDQIVPVQPPVVVQPLPDFGPIQPPILNDTLPPSSKKFNIQISITLNGQPLSYSNQKLVTIILNENALP